MPMNVHRSDQETFGCCFFKLLACSLVRSYTVSISDSL